MGAAICAWDNGGGAGGATGGGSGGKRDKITSKGVALCLHVSIPYSAYILRV